jgi:ectoine hydroxylase-related dioxygenase (phytanoyl-CoA dioxygenase family)
MQQFIRQIEQRGYCVIPQAYSEEQVEHALTLTRSWHEKCATVVSERVPYLNQNHPLVYNLQAKDWYFIELLFASEMLSGILRHFLNDPWNKAIPADKPNYILRSYTARSSNEAMPLHIDSFIPYPGPHVISIQCAMVLETQSTHNGCTVVVPGSHLSGKYATQDSYKDAVPIESNAGDLVLWDSRLWHATTPNRSQGTRWALLATYCRWWMKQHFNITGSLPEEFYRRLTDEQRGVLGFCSIPYETELQGIDMKRGYDLLPTSLEQARHHYSSVPS